MYFRGSNALVPAVLREKRTSIPISLLAQACGSFPRKIREYVLNRKIISMPFAVRASSSLAGEALRIVDRGRLTVGYFADVIAFDDKTIADKSTYEQPEVLAGGMKYVIVNGK